MAERTYRILALCGSLRRKSFNRAILRTAIEVAPGTLAFEVFDLAEIPPYNGDVEERGWPPRVEALREAIRQADGLFVATPEYNHSIPGVLKNALDWASRPPDMPFRGKPAGVIGASNGLIGTARCQAHLRQVFQTLGVHTMVHPEVLVSRAQDKLEEGRLTDEPTRLVIEKYVKNYAEWVGRWAGGRGEG